MLIPRTLKIRGFRGFRRDQGFHFDSPAIILFGENHCGKSSTLSAVEWCFFGDECKGKQTTIRERIDWIIANQHMKAPDVLVELELDSPDGVQIIRRQIAKSGKRSRGTSLEIELSDGEVLAGEKAEEHLSQLLRFASFRDFMTTVYQHQEAIRGIVTEEPRDRNDAIDRLLGLSEYRNLLSGISAADPRRWHKEITAKFQEFERHVQTVLDTWEKDLNEKREEAVEAGVTRNRLTPRTALASAAEVQEALTKFAQEIGIGPAALRVPEAWQGLAGFEKSAKKVIGRLRGEMPLAKEQEELFDRQSEVIQLQKNLEAIHKGRAAVQKSLAELGREHVGQQAVAKKLDKARDDLKETKARRKAANARADLIREAIDYLEKADGKELTGRCPVCESKVPNLLQSLHSEWDQSLRSLGAALDEKVRSLQDRVQELQEIADQYEQANEKQESLVRDLLACCREIGGLLERELTDKADPLALLDTEAGRVKRRLAKLRDAVQAKQERLNEIEAELDKVRLIREILLLEEKRAIIERIRESPEYGELEAARDRIAEFVRDLENIKAAVSEVANKEARKKLTAAEVAIDDYFRQLTRHPAVGGIKLRHKPDARTGRNAYEITDQDDRDLTPILSQGDLNALALAIFLGLASSSADTGTFGFVILDDPSQSLGTKHKEQLVKVLDKVAESKKIVLATMDREFRDCLADGLTKTKTEYQFKSWTPMNGADAQRT